MKLIVLVLSVMVTRVPLFVISENCSQQKDLKNNELGAQFNHFAEENLDTASSNSGAWYSSSDSDQGFTKTFERVVLEGSNIIISCPNFVALSPSTNSLFEVQTNTRFSQQKQASFVDQQELKSQAKYIPSEIKWFRNHVPMTKLDDFQHDKLNSRQEAQTLPIIHQINFNQTSKKQLPTFHDNEDYEKWQRGPHNNSLSFSTQPETLQTSLTRFRDSSTTKNVNELNKSVDSKLSSPEDVEEKAESTLEFSKKKQEDAKKLKEVPEVENSQWYINKFGELVINEVSQYFAGKYTCLVDGKQSEVLLDVLVDSGLIDKRNQEQAFKIEEPSTIEPFSSSLLLLPSPTPSSTAFSRLNFTFKNNNLGRSMKFVYHKAGNSRIETGKSFELGESASSFAPSSFLDEFENLGKQEEQKLRDNSHVDDNTSLEANSIKPFQGDTTGAGQMAGNNEQLLPLQEYEKKKLTVKSKEVQPSNEDDERNLLRDIDDELLEGNKRRKLDTPKTLSPRYSTTQQRHPIHVVKSEAIQINDLKFVPGFLYTKQKLYCPTLERTGSQFYTLIHAFCNPSNHPRLPTKASSFSHNGSEVLKCHRLAERLIWKLFAASMEGGSQVAVQECPALVSELIWFKDGKQLKFDTNGRETSMNLNVKLINFFDQLDLDTASESDSLEEEEEGFSSSSATPSSSDGGSGIKGKSSRSSRSSRGKTSRSSHSSKLRMCPITEGRVLEIDGLQRESSGRYTCAFRLSTSKINQIVRTLERLYRTDQSLRWAENDILCCDESLSTAKVVPNSRQKERPFSPSSQIETNEKIGIGGSVSSLNYSAQSYKLLEEQEEKDKTVSESNKAFSHAQEGKQEKEDASLLVEQVTILESILNGNVSNKQSLSYMKQSLSRFQNPIRTIQTFSLSVVEQPANSCDLWLTIRKASEAYTRRKLVEFKRLRRNIDDERKATTFPTNRPDFNRKVYLVEHKMDDDGKSSASSTNTIPWNGLAKTLTTHKSPYVNHGSLSNELEYQAQASKKIRRREYKMSALKHADSGTNEKATVRELESGNRFEGPLNVQRHLTSANNDSEWQTPTVRQKKRGDESSSMLVNNHDGDELDIEVEGGQTKALKGHHGSVRHLYYANEKNLDLLPIYATTTASTFGAADGDISESLLTRDAPSTKETDPYIESERQKKRFKRATYSTWHRVVQTDYLNPNEEEMPVDLITQRGLLRSRTGQNINTLINERQATSASGLLERNGSHGVVDDSGYHTLGGLAAIIDDNLTAQGREIGGDKMVALDAMKKSEIGLNPDKQLEVGQRKEATSTRWSLWVENSIDSGKRRNLATRKRLYVDSSRQGYSMQEDKLPLFDAGARYQMKDKLSSQLNSVSNQSSASVSTSYNNINFTRNIEPVPIDHFEGLDSGKKERSLLSLNSALFSSIKTKDKIYSSLSRVSVAGGETKENGLKQPVPNRPFATASPVTDDDADNDSSLDESLMWTAGQYLYMHMKALAASSMFGVEVSVEWSNERVNGSSIDLSHQANKEKYLPYDYMSYEAINTIRDAIPFATIDVISGQNLLLQCTAQALGRLPKVSWYKRVLTIPTHLKGLMRLARRIGHDLYWPLSELYLLDESEMNVERKKSFVCSQTNAIFDNLANQTFTVISSLQLSQYNDVANTGAIKSGLLLNDNYNLYACIVDADVRRNYATLGVNFRKAPSKISLEISKRLQARSAFTKSTDFSSTRTSSTPVEQEQQAKYDLFQQNILHIPAKSYWVPLHNSSTMRRHLNSDGSLLLTPSILMAVILFVFSSSIALIYLTVCTYRSLTNQMLEDTITDQTSYSPNRSDLYKTVRSNTLASPDKSNSTCLCHLKDQLDDVSLNAIPDFSSFYKDNPYLDGQIFVNEANHSLYEAHTHNVDLHYSCHELRTTLNAEFPSKRNKSNYSYRSNPKIFKQQFSSDYYQTTTMTDSN